MLHLVNGGIRMMGAGLSPDAGVFLRSSQGDGYYFLCTKDNPLPQDHSSVVTRRSSSLPERSNMSQHDSSVVQKRSSLSQHHSSMVPRRPSPVQDRSYLPLSHSAASRHRSNIAQIHSSLVSRHPSPVQNVPDLPQRRSKMMQEHPAMALQYQAGPCPEGAISISPG